MKRVFAAIDISETARQMATEYAAQLRNEFSNVTVRWDRPEKLHITVKFAGALDVKQFGIFTERVRSAAISIEPFRMKIDGTGAFIKRRGPSVLWLGVQQSSELDLLGTLAAKLDGEEKRTFHPHITIARVKDAKKAMDLIDMHRASGFESAEFEVIEIIIYESKLLPSGSVYSKLKAFRLACASQPDH